MEERYRTIRGAVRALFAIQRLATSWFLPARCLIGRDCAGFTQALEGRGFSTPADTRVFSDPHIVADANRKRMGAP
jgi:hypothetical protein